MAEFKKATLIEASEGPAIISRIADGEWLISLPWGEQRFSGTFPEARQEVRRLVADQMTKVKP